MNLLAPNPPIKGILSEDHPEYQRRLKAFEQARHHMRLEGLEMDAFGVAVAMMVVRGEITREQERQVIANSTPEQIAHFNNLQKPSSVV